MTTAYLLFGSNLGDRKENIRKSIKLLESHNILFIKISSFYSTEPWGKKDQPEFFNLVTEISTSLNPLDLLNLILGTENQLGRKREIKWDERIIDIDILYYGNEIIVKKDLKIPHSFLHERRFTLVPLAEIAPEFIHPVFNISSREMLRRCKDESEVILLKEY